MITRIKRPTILDHRPIAVTVNSSKIICTILRKKIEEHLSEKNIIFENQYGFTSGGKTEHCLFIIDYITNMTYESSRNKSLFFAFIDFKKAYDSVDKKRLIEVLLEFNINPHIINILVHV